MKIINVKLIPGSSSNSVEDFNSYLKVKTTYPPEDGKANRSMIKLLSDFYHIPKSNIRILQGTKLRKKLVEIDL